MRPRRTIAVSTAALLAVTMALSACDTDDGRAMQEPTEVQRWQLASTVPSTTSTTSTLVPIAELLPSNLAPAASRDPSVDPGASEPPPDSGSLAPTTSGVPTDSAGPTDSAAPTDSASAFVFDAPWADGEPIDIAYTCDGDDSAPLLTWTAPPEGAVELALAVTDDDADGYVHWVVVGLPPAAGSVGGDEPLTVGTAGENDFGAADWSGPCPPAGDAHTYRFTLYVLDQPLDQPTDSAPASLVAAIGAAAVEWAELTGTYQRAE